MDLGKIVLTIIVIILGLGIYGLFGFIIYKIIKKRQNKIKKILEDSLKKEEAQRLLNKRKKLSGKALDFLMWYNPIFGFICVFLGSVPIYFELEKSNDSIIIGKIIQGALVILLGLYLLISGSIVLYNNIRKKNNN